MQIQVYLKAITGAIIAGLTSLSMAYNDNHISNKEWVDVGISVFTVFGGVWAVPNAVKRVKARRTEE